MKSIIKLFFFYLCIVMLSMPLNVHANGKNEAVEEQPLDEHGDPLWDFLDGEAFITRKTPVYSCPSEKCEVLDTYEPTCEVRYYSPVNSDGYGKWLRLQGYNCLRGDRSVYGGMDGFILEENTDGYIDYLYVYPFDRNADDHDKDFDFQIRACDNDGNCPIRFDSRKDNPNDFFVNDKQKPLPSDKYKRTGCSFSIQTVKPLSPYENWLLGDPLDAGCKTKNPKLGTPAFFKFIKKPRAPLDINKALDVVGYRPTGGLILEKNEPIAIQSQELIISGDEIEVNTVYENKINQDITTNVFFSLPPLEIDPKTNTSHDIQGYGIDITKMSAKDRFMNFEAWVDGKKLDLKEQRHVIKAAERGKDKDALQISFYWQQTFQANKPVKIKLVYEPFSGSGAFQPIKAIMKSIMNEQTGDEFCIDQDFINGVIAKEKVGYTDGLVSPIGYFFQTSENWNGGSIGDLRLVIDKGKTKNLISFCGDDVKKISPTQFEMRAKNYIPQEDLSILILKGWEK